ncbi:MAG: hypothetical protein ACD_29C00288G0001 [uncultured bacterium]|nr:MAG: hypothetical protein ACD_29C00288G0001 [uncultured bacterium]
MKIANLNYSVEKINCHEILKLKYELRAEHFTSARLLLWLGWPSWRGKINTETASLQT